MANPIYTDLKILDGDLALDEFGQPIFIFDRDVIAQDLRHAIQESGLLELLIGERSQSQRKLIFKKLRILVETDLRIVPGTSQVETVTNEKILISGETDFGPISLGASL
ncbi:MAG: DUF2590 family protein [Bermanella sp.]